MFNPSRKKKGKFIGITHFPTGQEAFPSFVLRVKTLRPLRGKVRAEWCPEEVVSGTAARGSERLILSHHLPPAFLCPQACSRISRKDHP